MTDDLYDRRYAAALAEMKNAGIRTSNGNPPYLRIARKLGFAPRPPYYLPFWRVVLPFAAYFALTWGVTMYFVMWRRQGFPLWFDCCLAMITGLLWGLSMALWYRYVRRKRHLSNWEDLA